MTPELEVKFVVCRDVAQKHVTTVMLTIGEQMDVLEVVLGLRRAEIMGAILLSLVREFTFLAEATEMAERDKTTATRTVVENLLNTLSSAGRKEQLLHSIKEARNAQR